MTPLSFLCVIIPRFFSRISLPDNCLSVSRAIQLACELVPHAEETLAVTNPLGAKPVIIEMFEAEITPNLRGVDFFPITHRCVKKRFARFSVLQCRRKEVVVERSKG